MSNRFATRLAVIAVGAIVPVLVTAAPALAKVNPDDGEVRGPSLGLGNTILLFVVVPLGAFLIIAGLSVLPSALSRPRYRPGKPWDHAPRWVGSEPDAAAASADPRPEVAQVPSGEAFTADQVNEMEQAVRTAQAETGLGFALYLGGAEGDIRDEAEKLHSSLGASAPSAVLIVVSPGDRLLEIVTGEVSARRLSDRACALAALSMTTAFAGGDLVGGVVTGVRMLAESAGKPLPASR